METIGGPEFGLPFYLSSWLKAPIGSKPLANTPCFHVSVTLLSHTGSRAGTESLLGPTEAPSHLSYDGTFLFSFLQHFGELSDDTPWAVW